MTAENVISPLPHKVMVANILSVYDNASAQDKRDGADWYPATREFIRDHAARNGVDPVNAVAAFAWLSPQVSYARNVEMFLRLLDLHVHDAGRDPLRLSWQTTDERVMHAWWALGGDLGSLDLSPSSRHRKVRSFFRNILGLEDVVTIDRHLTNVAYGFHGRSRNGGWARVPQPRGGAYVKVQHAYIEAARMRGVRPTAMQATTWIARRGGSA